MRYVKVVSTEDGGSRFEEAELEAREQLVAEGVPPMLVSGPHPMSAVMFITQPRGREDWEPHVAPRRQWIFVIAGRGFIQTTDGERREFGPGDVAWVEDTTGTGHVSGALTDEFTIAFVIPQET